MAALEPPALEARSARAAGEWTVHRRSAAGQGLRFLLSAVGFACVPMIGPLLAIGVVLLGIGLLFSSFVSISGPCPYCGVRQAAPLPAVDARGWRDLRTGSTTWVVGIDCAICANRMIVRTDDRVAIPVPKVVAACRS